jgi:hypothetical protein
MASAEMSISVGARYDTFADPDFDEANGHEWTFPFGMRYQSERWLLRLETAYSLARVDYGLNPELASLTDTLLAASYIRSDWPVGVVLGVDVNLPTGQERLTRNEQIAEAGERHDLFEVDNFGEGLNVGLNLGLTKALGDVTFAVSGAYFVKGKYDPSSDISGDDLDPGDQIVVMAVTKWKIGAGVSAETTLAYVQVAADTLGGKETFQEGRKIMLAGTLSLQRPKFGVTVGMQNTFQDNNKELSDDALVTEAENSNGNELFGWWDLTYRLSSAVDIQVLGDWRLYGESDRKHDLNGLPFEGRRVRFSVGPAVLYLQNDHITWNGVVKYFSMDQHPDIRNEQTSALRGVNVSVGMTYTF